MSCEDELKRIVTAFIRDLHAWEVFAAAEYDWNAHVMPPSIPDRYRALVDEYCVPGKRHQGLAISVDHDPDRETIQSVRIDGGTAMVFTRMERESGLVCPYEYEFVRERGRWLLVEVYYNDGSGRYECI